MMTEPGFKMPRLSASSIMAFAMQSLTEPAGLKYSSLAKIFAFKSKAFFNMRQFQQRCFANQLVDGSIDVCHGSALHHRVETVLQVSQNVVDVLCADGQPDGAGLDALIQKFLVGELAVGGSRRVDDQTLDIGSIGKERENLQTVDKPVGFFHAALNLKGEDGAAVTREIFFVQGVVGMVRQAGVVDLLH